MPQAFYILLGAGLTVLTAIALGKLLLRGLSIQLYKHEETVLGFVVGSACLSLLVFLVTAAGVAREGVFVGLAILILAVAYGRGVHRGPSKALPASPPFFKALFAVIFAAFTVLYFFNAMAPETSPDGMSYHLGLVNQYLLAGRFPHITTNLYASLSEGVEMLFLFAFSMGRHSAAALVHFAFLLALPLAMLFYAKRFGFPAAGLMGALLVYCAPVAGRDGTCAYNDVATACVVFAVFYLLQIWDRERTAALLIPIGLLAGFAYATKYTAFVAVPYALGFAGWKLHRSRQPLVRPLVIIGVCALVMMAPWMVKNWMVVQNPFSPFLNAVFPNPYVHISFEEFYRNAMRHDVRLKGWWEIPWEVTVRGTYLCGVVGPLFLLAPLALLALRNRHGRQLLLAGAVFGLTYATNIATRFLLPALPFLALAMALVFVRWKYVAAMVLVGHAILSWPSVLATFMGQGAWRLVGLPVHAALRLESEDAYLTRTCPGYVLARAIESLVPPGKRVLSIGTPARAYTSREILVGYEGAFNARMVDTLGIAADEGLQASWLLRFRFPPRRLGAIRVVQTAAGGDFWSISEFRIIGNAQELLRTPQWRLRSDTFPWDLPLAFDHNPVTRWRSWERLYDGMFVRVDFGQPEIVDSVLLECSHDQWNIKLKLEGQLASHEWKTLADAPEASEITPPAGLRRLASQTLKNNGIDYLLVNKNDALAKDFSGKSREWNLTLLREVSADSLYRLN